MDTSAFLALNDSTDQYHAASRKMAAILQDHELVISDAVLTETYNLLRYRSGFHMARYFLETVLAGSPFVFADITMATRKTTLQILEKYSDQKISYCDALSVAIMQEQQIQHIFAFDHHFEIMGAQLIRV